jgi:hypothetical protein
MSMCSRLVCSTFLLSSDGVVAGFMHAPPLPPPPVIVCARRFSSWRIESRCASSLARSLLPTVARSPLSSPVMTSSTLLRRRSRFAAAAAPPPPVDGTAPPNTVLNADSGDPMVGRLFCRLNMVRPPPEVVSAPSSKVEMGRLMPWAPSLSPMN